MQEDDDTVVVDGGGRRAVAGGDVGQHLSQQGGVHLGQEQQLAAAPYGWMLLRNVEPISIPHHYTLTRFHRRLLLATRNSAIGCGGIHESKFVTFEGGIHASKFVTFKGAEVGGWELNENFTG
uniref:Uncharacterized protein n=1 Tax=Oryza barthii TaxID=65489 RepID=A0A0D3HU03_9ORYZ